MTRILTKHPRLRLDLRSYKGLCCKVLARDNWTCQVCGSRKNLQVHHKQLRSQQGSDEESNLITLCAECHGGLHHGYGKNPRLTK
jgi:5-methylcytosine-specific restriction endonuclease McrA